MPRATPYWSHMFSVRPIAGKYQSCNQKPIGGSRDNLRTRRLCQRSQRTSQPVCSPVSFSLCKSFLLFRTIVTILGPPKSPYENQLYDLRLVFDDQFPEQAPVIQFIPQGQTGALPKNPVCNLTLILLFVILLYMM